MLNSYIVKWLRNYAGWIIWVKTYLLYFVLVRLCDKKKASKRDIPTTTFVWPPNPSLTRVSCWSLLFPSSTLLFFHLHAISTHPFPALFLHSTLLVHHHTFTPFSPSLPYLYFLSPSYHFHTSLFLPYLSTVSSFSRHSTFMSFSPSVSTLACFHYHSTSTSSSLLVSNLPLSPTTTLSLHVTSHILLPILSASLLSPLHNSPHSLSTTHNTANIGPHLIQPLSNLFIDLSIYYAIFFVIHATLVVFLLSFINIPHSSTIPQHLVHYLPPHL